MEIYIYLSINECPKIEMKFQKIYKITKISLIIMFILTASIVTVPIQAKYPAEKKGSPDHYSRSGEIDHLEDLFFPHDYTGDFSYNFTLPDYLSGNYGHYFTFKKPYRGYVLAPFENESDLPPDYVSANFSIQSSDGKYIFTEDNKRTDIGGGSVDGIEFTADKNVWVNNTGGCEFSLFEYPNWNNILHEPQKISFKGVKRTFMLWGISELLKNFDQQQKYIQVKINTNVPVRAYAFDTTGKHDGELIDYNEKKTKSKKLDFLDEEKSTGVSCEPRIGFSTIDGQAKEVNITLKVKVIDIPENKWMLPIIVGSVFAVAVGAAIWVSKKKS